MKQCPRCKKEVPEHAKICPHCGYRLDTKYKPVKKSGRSLAFIYIVLALVFMFSPMLLSHFIGQNILGETPSSPSQVASGDKIVLGELGDVENEPETILYYFTDLKAFEAAIEGDAPQVDNIRAFEKDIDALSDEKVEKKYTFYVTDLENVYYDLRYTINLDSSHFIDVRLTFDMGKISNQVIIKGYQKGLSDWDTIVNQEVNNEKLKEILNLINPDESDEMLDTVTEDFSAQEESFASRKGNLGHYGLGANAVDGEHSFSMRVTGQVNDYTVKTRYYTMLGKEQFKKN